MITRKQKEVFDFVKMRTDTDLYAPSLDEIKKQFGFASVSTAHYHIARLKKSGLLKKQHHKARAISIAENKALVKIPLVGVIAAGQPIEAIETPRESIAIARSDLGASGSHYALRVQGDSMIGEGIFDGDIVVIRKEQTAQNGQTVVAIIDDNEATLKKLYREKGRFRLQPANQSMLPIYRREVEVRGIVVKIIRNLDVPSGMVLIKNSVTNIVGAFGAAIERENIITLHKDLYRPPTQEGGKVSITLDNIEDSNTNLENRFRDKLIVNHDLKRTLVSFQANKKTPGYRWYKFKEGYSSALVDYTLDKLGIKSGKVFDPFAGSGTSLFASAERGLDTVGIELLPLGAEVIEVRKIIFESNDQNGLTHFLQNWIDKKPWGKEKNGRKINHLKITNGAFPKKTDEVLGKFLTTIDKIKNKAYQRVLRFALLCVLEEISFTRKDGQCLRWDYRSGRGRGKNNFDKGEIKDFDQAIIQKLQDILSDIGEKNTPCDFADRKIGKRGNIEVLKGSCFSILPTLQNNTFDFLMTSPPYCNRYDYTRTYALELALLDVDEQKIRDLRQAMMSCTVENRDKENLEKLFSRDVFRKANDAFENQQELQMIIKYLEEKKKKKELNNPGIARMVRNYFYETTLIVFECARLLKSGAYFVMVNDNVRYAGAHIPVDLILSDIARDAGFNVEKIWVLPTGKGNSSQQMGTHGREELRKCVYVWKKLGN